MKKLAIIFFLAANCVWAQSQFGIDILNGNLPAIDQVLGSNDLEKKYTRGFFTLNKNELRLLRNTIYAENGFIFNSSDLQKHFSKFSWYKGTKKNVDAILLGDEKRDIETIKAIEDNYPDLPNNPLMRDLIGTWVYFNNSYEHSITWEDIDNEAAIRQSSLYSFFPNGCTRVSKKRIGYGNKVLYGTWFANDKIQDAVNQLWVFSVLHYIYGRSEYFGETLFGFTDFAVENVKAPNGKTYKGIISIYEDGSKNIKLIKVSDDYRFY